MNLRNESTKIGLRAAGSLVGSVILDIYQYSLFRQQNQLLHAHTVRCDSRGNSHTGPPSHCTVGSAVQLPQELEQTIDEKRGCNHLGWKWALAVWKNSW